MKNMVFLGALGALITGIAIGIQAYFNGRTGSLIGPFQTGLWTNFLGGALAGILILTFVLAQGKTAWQLPGNSFLTLVASGALGILIITGITFSVNRAGIAASLTGTLFGQLLIGVIADSMGWGGAEPIPLDLRRVAGLLVMALSVILLLPRE